MEILKNLRYFVPFFLTFKQKGKQSSVTKFIGDGSGKIKSSFYPSKSLNFFNDKDFQTPKEKAPKVGDEAKTVDFSQSPNDSTDKELMKKFKINVKSSGVKIPPLLRSFEELSSVYKIRPYIVKNIKREGLKDPMPVQMQALPAMFNRIECVVAAPTGSGKTLSYVIPILRNLNKSSKEMKKGKGGFRALVIVPTGLLVDQIQREFMKVCVGKQWSIRKLLKNTKYSKEQMNSKYNDVLIATPNRLVTLIRKEQVILSTVEHLVIDEADRLFDMGFIEQIDEIITACSNSNIHRSLFSATVPLGVEHLAKTFLRNPLTVTIGIKNTGSETINQKLLYVSNEEGKLLALRNMFFKGLNPPVLIFVNTIEKAHELYKKLIFENYHIDYITSKRNPNKITEIIQQYRIGKIWALICTDIMARGLDVLGISVVVNYDFPKNEIEYIHRIGRTGRAGKLGEAITFYSDEDRIGLKNIVNVIKRSGQSLPEWILKMDFQPTKKRNRKKPNLQDEFEGDSKKRKFQ